MAKEVNGYASKFNAAELRRQYAAALDKPALEPLVDVPGYENVLWGGRQAVFLALNVSELYDTLRLQAAVKAGFGRGETEGLAKALIRAEVEGLIPAELPAMRPAEWRAVLRYRNLTVAAMVGLLQGWADWKLGRKTTAVGQLVGALAKLAPLAKTPEVQALVPASEKAGAVVDLGGLLEGLTA